MNNESRNDELSRLFLVGAGLTLVVVAGVAAFAPSSQLAPARVSQIGLVLDTATVLGGVAVFALCLVTWRQIADSAAVWAGAATLMVGVAAASRPELAGALLGGWAPGSRSLAAVADAALAVAPVLFAAGLVPWVERRPVGPAALAAGAMAAVAVLAVVLRAVPSSGPALVVSQLTRGDGGGSVLGGVLAVGVWLGLGVAYTVRGIRRRWLSAWAGLLLFAVTLAGMAGGAARPDNAWAVGAGVLESVGMLLALIACQLELTRAYEHQSLQLFDSALDAETAEVRARVRAAGLRVERHDLANAITAIDGAAMILEGELERLSGKDREALARVVGSGTARLRHLLEQESGGLGQVSMAESAASVASDPRWGDGQFEVEVTPDLVAAGSPGETVEAVRQLVDYASRRAPGQPVTLRGERDGQWVVLRVEDRGPTMNRQLRRTVLEDESRRVPGPADAMGLQVAARLMRGQGGDLWVEARPGGGTSFGICLPAVVAGNGDGGASDE